MNLEVKYIFDAFWKLCHDTKQWQSILEFMTKLLRINMRKILQSCIYRVDSTLKYIFVCDIKDSFWSPCVTTYYDLESKIKTQDTSPQFCKCQQWKNDACAIGSYVFEITWFETKRSGHMAIMRNPYRLPYPKSAFIKLDKGVKCLIKSALKCVFVALTKNQLLL